MNESIVYTPARLKKAYGDFFQCATPLALDKKRVPKPLWPLLPYAAFWGISDDWTRESLVRKAPAEVRKNVLAVIGLYDDALDAWLAGPEASSSSPTTEYIAYSAMRMGADFMSVL